MNTIKKAAKVKSPVLFGEGQSVVVVFFFAFDIATSESIAR
jgi:hypothetical protein